MRCRIRGVTACTAVLCLLAALAIGQAGAHADVFGLGPTVLGSSPSSNVKARGASESPGPLPSSIVGLEGYALWGKNAGAASAVTYKHQFASTRIGDRKLRWRYGLIGGLQVGGDHANALAGGFIEGEVEGLVGLVLIVRFDDGVYVNPGLKVNLLSTSF